MIKLTNLDLQLGSKTLFAQTNLTVFPKHRIGVIGANGCGKSSLFKLLRKKIEHDSGEFSIPSSWTISHLAQETPALDQSAVEYVLDGDQEYRQIETQLATEEDGNKIAALYTDFGNIDGYTASIRAAQLLHGLGFKQNQINLPVKEFSGGWRMRLNLAQALMCRSDLLLLDEPTNHLDLDAIIWLEQWLKSYQGTLVLISHDRDFLDNVVTEIAHIENQSITLYTGNYETFEKTRAEKLALQQAQHVKQQKQIDHMQKLVDKFRYKASKAKQAQSRIKAMEKMEVIAAVHANSPFSFQFKAINKVSDPLLSVKHVELGYPKKQILNEVNLSISPGDRIGLLGPNGAGKSTFIKYLANQLTSQAGEKTDGHHLKVAYFAQHQLDVLDDQASPLLHFQRLDNKASEQVLRNFLGGFAFHNDQIFDPIAHFSGGEKSRLALALLVWQQPNLLLLDEPTNHLDIEMRESLNLALQNFEGAMVIVSHDRHLLRSCVDQFYLVANQQLQPYDGNLNDYKTWLTEHRKASLKTESISEKQINPPRTNSKKETQEQKREAALNREKQQPLKKRIQSLEKNIAQLTGQAKQIEQTLCDEALYLSENKEQLKQLLKKQTDTQSQLDHAEIEWLQSNEDLAKLM